MINRWLCRLATIWVLLVPAAVSAQSQVPQITPKSIAMLQRAMAINRYSLEDVTARVMSLADILITQDRPQEAVLLTETFLRQFENTLPAGQRDTLMLAVTHARAIGATGRQDLELQLRYITLDAQMTHLGRSDFATLLNLGDMVEILKSRQAFQDAAALQRLRVLGGEEMLGADNPWVVLDIVELHWFLRQSGQTVSANQLQPNRDARLTTLLRRQDLDDPLPILTIAHALMTSGDLVLAEAFLKLSINLYVSIGDPDDIYRLMARQTLARMLEQQERHREALPVLAANIAEVQSDFGSQSFQMLVALNDYARVLKNAGRFAAYEGLISRRLALADLTLGPNSLAKDGILKEHLEFLSDTQGRRVTPEDLATLLQPDSNRNSAQDFLENAFADLPPDALTYTMGPAFNATDRLAQIGTRLDMMTKESQSRIETMQRIRTAIVRIKTDPAIEAVTRASINRLMALPADRDNAQELFRYAIALSQVDTNAAVTAANVALTNKLELLRRATANTDSEGDARTALNIVETAQTVQNLAIVASRNGPDSSYVASRHSALQTGFAAAQVLHLDRTSDAVRRVTLRRAGGDTALADMIGVRDGLMAHMASLDLRLTQLVMEDDTRTVGRHLEALAQNMAETDRTIAQIDQILRVQFPAFFDQTATQIMPFSEIVTPKAPLITADQALVMIVPPPAGDTTMPTTVWVVADSGLNVGVVHPDIDLPDLISRLRGQLDRPATPAIMAGLRAPRTPGATTAPARRTGMAPFDLALAHQIYAALFIDTGLQSVLAGKPDWIVVLNGQTLSLPLAALVTLPPVVSVATTPADLRAAQWLGTRHSITVLPSVAALRDLFVGQAAPAELTRYVGFGDPVFNGAPAPLRTSDQARMIQEPDRPRMVASLPRLPGTYREVTGIAQLFSDAILRTGPKASETELSWLASSGQLERAQVLHFATHGLLAGGAADLNEAALAMTPPDRATRDAISGILPDGLLTSSEIATLRLNAEWVVLSACNTAGSGKITAQGLTGLAQAFFYAGARSLLMTHWAVRDDIAERLVTDTVRRANGTATRAQALQAAMSAVIADTSQDTRAVPLAHPALWAPFHVIGAPK